MLSSSFSLPLPPPPFTAHFLLLIDLTLPSPSPSTLYPIPCILFFQSLSTSSQNVRVFSIDRCCHGVRLGSRPIHHPHQQSCSQLTVVRFWVSTFVTTLSSHECLTLIFLLFFSQISFYYSLDGHVCLPCPPGTTGFYGGSVLDPIATGTNEGAYPLGGNTCALTIQSHPLLFPLFIMLKSFLPLLLYKSIMMYLPRHRLPWRLLRKRHGRARNSSIHKLPELCSEIRREGRSMRPVSCGQLQRPLTQSRFHCIRRMVVHSWCVGV